MKCILAILLVIMVAGITNLCNADSLQVTTTPVAVAAKRGEAVAMSVNLKNNLTPREPVTITAQIEWEDEYGVAQTSSESATINIAQPVKVTRYKVAIPALFDFVAGSAKVDGQPVTPTSGSDGLVIELGRTLLEGKSMTLEYSVKAQ
ncbi:MAG: hypothetical protein ACYC64_17690 [Armatimonadota bacterium]